MATTPCLTESQPGPTGLDDLPALRRREAAAVERWFQEHAAAVYSFVYHRAGRDERLAEDVVHDTFISALQRLDDFDPERGPMRLWLLLRSRNCLRVYQRRAGRQIGLDQIDPSDDESVTPTWDLDHGPLPPELLEKKETTELVGLTLAALPDRYRRLLLGRYAREDPLAAMAQAEGLSESAVKSLLHRARQAFKAAWQAIQNGRSAAGAKNPSRKIPINKAEENSHE